jgi:hypothetical protein
MLVCLRHSFAGRLPGRARPLPGYLRPSIFSALKGVNAEISHRALNFLVPER